MKSKLLIVCVCLFTITLQSWAQIRLGVKGGINLSKISFSGESSNLAPENRTGFSVGPVVDAKIPFFGLGMEVSALYSQSYLDSYFAKATLKSIEVPVHLKWSASVLRLLGVYAALGPQFGFNVGERQDSYFRIRKRNTSFNVGGGIILLNHLQLGLNYNFAITRTATLSVPTEIDGSFYDVKVRNNSWQVSLAYLF